MRETLEEAGVDIEIKGILSVQHSPRPRYTRLRIIFYAVCQANSVSCTSRTIACALFDRASAPGCHPGLLCGTFSASVCRRGPPFSHFAAVSWTLKEPRDLDQAPKSIPCYESAGASWIDAEQLVAGDGDASALRLRGSEPLVWTRYLLEGGAVHPLSLLMSGEQ